MRLLTLEADPSFGGGCEAVSLAVSKGMAERGHEVFLLHDVPGTMIPDYAAFTSGIGRTALAGFGWRSPVSSFNSAIEIAAYARANRCDVIFSSHLGQIRPIVIAGKLASIPAVFHLGLNCSTPSLMDRLFYRSIAAGIAPSEHTKAAWLAGGFKPERLFCVPNWVDGNRFKPVLDRPALRRELGLSAEDALIVYVGRVTPEKGLAVLMRALSIVRATVPHARAVVVGGYSTIEPALTQLKATLGLPDGAWISRGITSESEKYFAAADIACVPSIGDESFGLTLIEAMASAVPVVATNVGIFPAILGNFGNDMLVPPDDPAALADRLAWWLLRPEHSKCRGLELRDRALLKYGPGQSLDVYQHLLFDHHNRNEKTTVTSGRH